ncbi:unnamed protein product [Tuber aestivum]|uniref:Uncharacterized protein n=1 Tax=Tuber aestivum TaxID=59557 RepID=A0A292PMG5_9PEZI|nr:unnamed protein product [Tuber aestivum]
MPNCEESDAQPTARGTTNGSIPPSTGTSAIMFQEMGLVCSLRREDSSLLLSRLHVDTPILRAQNFVHRRGQGSHPAPAPISGGYEDRLGFRGIESEFANAGAMFGKSLGDLGAKIRSMPDADPRIGQGTTWVVSGLSDADEVGPEG